MTVTIYRNLQLPAFRVAPLPPSPVRHQLSHTIFKSWISWNKNATVRFMNTPTHKPFVLENFNFIEKEEKESEMQKMLNLLNSSHFKKLVIHRGAVINENDWLDRMLTAITKKAPQKIEITALSEQFMNGGAETFVYPTLKELLNEGARLQFRDLRPNQLTFLFDGLSKEYREALPEILSQGSHAAEYTIKLSWPTGKAPNIRPVSNSLFPKWSNVPFQPNG